jgi:hypothetical protein
MNLVVFGSLTVPPKDGFTHIYIYKPKGLEENIKDVYKNRNYLILLIIFLHSE